MTATAPVISSVDLRRRLWTAPALSAIPGVVHGVTGRIPGVETGEGNIGFGAPRDRDLAWSWRQRWSTALGVDPEKLVAARQVHGTAVLRVVSSDAGRGARPGSEPVGTADALLTSEPDLPLLSLHADCQPIFFVDPVLRVVGVAHAGWRGAVADVVGATVHAMAEGYGSDPATLWVVLGPAIGGDRYEVGPEVLSAWRETAGDGADIAIRNGEGQSRFDLSAANGSLLVRAGVRPENISVADDCTVRDGDRWFSHRGQGAGTGRFGAIIALTADRSPW